MYSYICTGTCTCVQQGGIACIAFGKGKKGGGMSVVEPWVMDNGEEELFFVG